MNEAVLAAIRDKLGRSQRVINALDKSDADSILKVDVTDPRVRVMNSLEDVAGQTACLELLPSSNNRYTGREDGFIAVACYAAKLLDAVRIRTAVKKEINDPAQSWESIDAEAGIIQDQHYVGDGGASWDQAVQLYRADGSIGMIVQSVP